MINDLLEYFEKQVENEKALMERLIKARQEYEKTNKWFVMYLRHDNTFGACFIENDDYDFNEIVEKTHLKDTNIKEIISIGTSYDDEYGDGCTKTIYKKGDM
jgi:hypothetical protein